MKLQLAAIMAIALGIGFLGSCKKKTPAEKVGDAVEDFAEDVGDAVEDAGDEVEDTVEE